MTYSLEGRVAIITGASQGLGLAIAQAYVTAGASVLLCARDREMLEQASVEVTSRADRSQTVVVQVADVAKPADVDRLVDVAFRIFPRIHILVNNAGVYGPMGPIEEVDWDAWVKAIEINLFGSVLLSRGVLPHFKAHRYGKIVQLSGGGATNPLPWISAYATSKAATIRFAETLAEEVREHHIDVNSIAPGALNTRLLDQVLAVGSQKVGKDFYNRALHQKEQGGTPLEKGAELAVFLGSAASDGITGKLVSAVWDPWENLPDYREDLHQTDVYTLRRIVPQDRGLDWGEK
jgi:NAD(P)-dependent dehydrogenase (short-subunit alcohol dehydrogenase family)